MELVAQQPSESPTSLEDEQQFVFADPYSDIDIAELLHAVKCFTGSGTAVCWLVRGAWVFQGQSGLLQV